MTLREVVGIFIETAMDDEDELTTQDVLAAFEASPDAPIE